jgi:hypothetical protein
MSSISNTSASLNIMDPKTTEENETNDTAIISYICGKHKKLIYANLCQNFIYMSYKRLYSYYFFALKRPLWFAKPNSNKKACSHL